MGLGFMGGGAMGGGPTGKAAAVNGNATGTIYTLSRLLGSSSTLGLLNGTDANLTLAGTNIQATTKLIAATQTAIVRETNGPLAAEYPIVLTGDGGPLAFANFTSGSYSDGSFASMFTFTRASVATDLMWDSPPAYAFQTWQVNEPRIVQGKGLLMEDAATNYFQNSNTPASQTISVPAGASQRLWINAGPGGSVTIAPGTAAFTDTFGTGFTATQGNVVTFTVQTAGTVNVTVNGPVYRVQIGTMGSYIPTGGGTGTRAKDSLLPIAGGSIKAVCALGSAAVVTQGIENQDGSRPNRQGLTPSFTPTFYMGSNIMAKNNYDGGYFTGNDQGGDATSYATCGTGKGSTGFTSAITWNPTDRYFSVNGSPPMHAGPAKVTNSTTINFFDKLGGWARRIDVYDRKLTNTELRARSIAGYPYGEWLIMGDSLVERAEGGSNITTSAQIGAVIGKACINGGQGGATAGECYSRMNNDPSTWGYALIIGGPGWNDLAASVTNSDYQARILAYYTQMAALTTSGKVVVSSLLAGTGEKNGTARRTVVDAVNAANAATYSSRYVDTLSLLIAAADPANPMDMQDQAAGIVPWSLRLPATSRSLSAAITASQTSFAFGGTTAVNEVVQIENEWIQVLASSGNTITSCTRGYGGSTAAAHASGAPIQLRDVVHLAEAGHMIVANAIGARINALGL